MNGAPLPGDMYPLTTAQREIWFDQLLHGDAPIYKIGGYTQILGEVDSLRFEHAVNLLVQKHDALRIVLVPGSGEDGVPQQAIAKTLAVRVPLHDFSSAADPAAAALAYAEQQLATPFPLDGEPLFRFELLKLNDTRFYFTLNFHHLIVDGWAIGLLVDSLAQLYSALEANDAPELVAPSYAEFIDYDQAFHRSPQFERSRAYWLDKYRTVPDPLFAPRYRERFGASAAPAGHHALCLPRAFYERIVALAQSNGSTPFHVMLGLLYVYFSRTAQRDDLAMGLPILNRSNARMKATAGMFTGVSAVRLQFDGTLRFDELLKSLGQVLKQDYRHQRFPVSELNRAIGVLQSQRAQVFDLSVSYERDDYDMRFGAGAAQVNMCSNGHEQLPLALHIRENRFDENAWIHFMYNRAYFEHDEIEAIGARFEHLLDQVLDDVRIPVDRLLLPAPAETATLLQWNAGDAAFAQDQPIHRLFESRVAEAPESIAVEYEGERLTYAELNARANQLAHRLIAHGVKPDDRVAICVERGLGMIVGLLGILKAGAGYVPLDPAYPADRLAYTLQDSAPLAVLVQADTRGVLGDPGDLSVPVIELDAAAASADQPTHNPVVEGLTARHLAYVIYTSGSTGRPKGVMIEHRNVTRLFSATDAWFGFGAQDAWALFHSFAFDFSVWEIWGALLHGGRLVVVPKLTSRSPQACYALLCESGVTVLNQTPSAFRQLIAAQAESGDTHRLRQVIFGGEALEVSMLKPWYEDPRNRQCQLVNMYGITETTVHVTYWPLHGSGRTSAGTSACIGRPIPDLSAYVVDANLNPMPVGVPGELCIGGAGLARGYLNRPELTGQRFIRDPFSEQADARLYRTGDLARFLPDGTLEYLGRIDSQVKIRGFRIELGEIEAALAALDGVHQALVVAREDEPGEKQLVAYVVFHQDQDPGDQLEHDSARLRAELARTLPDFMLPAHFVPMERFPLTANGKVDQKALPRPAQSVNRLQYVAPRTPVEALLAAIWAHVLRLDQVGVNDNFFASGGDSIRAVSVLSKAKEQGIVFALVDLFTHQTIANLTQALSLDTFDTLTTPGEIATASLASALQLSAADQAKLPEGVEEAYPLTFLQRGMVYHNQQASEHAALYHDVFSYRFSVPAWHEGTLRTVLDALVRKHPVLRTSFDFQRFDEPLQLVHADGQVPLTVIDLSMHDDAQQERLLAEFVDAERKTVFTLDQAPLLRVFIHLRRVGDLSQIQYTLSFHHAILDGWSVASLNTELFDAYLKRLGREQSDLVLTPLARSPRMAVESERSALASHAHRDFWRTYLDGHSFCALPPSDDQTDRTAEAAAQSNQRVSIDETVRVRLKAVANALGVPMRSVLLSAHLRVLSMLSGKTDVTTGLVSNVREEQADGEKVLGLFLNTLPLRQTLTPTSWAELIRQTFSTELDVIRYRHYPYFQLQLDNDRAPLYEVAFNYINFHVYEALEQNAGFVAHGGEGFEATNFALSVNFADTSSELVVDIKLDTARLSFAQGTRILGYYAAVLDAIAADAQADHSHGDFLPAAERHQVLAAWNDTQVAYPQNTCIHELFEAQAARQPDAVAVVFDQQRVSYRQLNERANRLAHHLGGLGIGPDSRVAVCVERSIDMTVALLAVLKAGGAYVPLDADYPEDRLRYMLGDAAPVAVLTQHSVRRRLGALLDAQPNVPVLELDGPQRPWEANPADNLPVAQIGLTREHLAYVIYTSGSTGRPKGVMNEHRGVVNRLLWMQQTYGLDASDAVLQKTPFSFDVSVWEFFWPLLAGARLVMASPQGHKDPAYLKSLIQSQRITTLHFVPSMLEVFLAQGDAGQCDSLKRVFCSGEALSLASIRRFNAQLSATPLFNLYGPTEAAVDVTAWTCDPQAPAPAIGRPVANTRIYLLNGAGQPVPVGVAGELHIAGVQVARGYLNRPELTAEKFVDDPFSDEPHARMYKTGDLARYLPDGNIEYLGRNDDQVKIRGFRIELGEIEARLAQHPAIGEAVVLARSDNAGDRRLVAYYTLSVAAERAEQPDVEQWRTHLGQTLPDYMVPAAYVYLDRLPLTPNGKLDRKALPAPDSEAYVQREYEAPRDPIEQTLAAIWSQLLKVERVGRHDNFFELGGHSLLMVSLIERMREAGLRADIRVLFSAPTLVELAAHAGTVAQAADGSDAAGAIAIAPNPIPAGTQQIVPAMLSLVELKQYEIDAIVATVPGGAANVQDIYPLAPLQEGILYHHRSAAHGDPYVLHGLFAFASRAHLDGFVDALQRVIERHDILRTAIVWEGLDEPVQVVWRNASLGLDEVALNPADGDIARQLQARFDSRHTRLDVRQAPLMRLTYSRNSAQNSVADSWIGMLRFHHMALDHAALSIVQQEVQAYLRDDAAGLPEPMPYRTYVAQVRGDAKQQNVKRDAQEAFFREMLETIDEPTLPFGRGEVQGDGGIITERGETLSSALASRLRAQARQLGVSAASLCHLAWGRVVSVVSGREDAVFGTVLLGRFQGAAGSDRALGLFINTLPLRVSAGAQSVRAGVKETAARLAALLEHEHASLALAQRCSGVAAPAPLFSALLNYRHGVGHESLVTGQQTWRGIEMLESHERTNYPLVLSVDDFGDGFGLTVQAVAGIDAERICGYMRQALESLVDALESAPHTQTRALTILPALERHEVLKTFNATDVTDVTDAAFADVPHLTIHARVEAQAARTPHAIAVTHDEQSLTYGELNARANRLAHRLIGLGVQPDDRVAICVERSVEMVVGLLAIVKAGGAYVPMDPGYPAERLAYLLTDSAPVALLMHARTAAVLEQAADGGVPRVDIGAAQTPDALDSAAHNPTRTDLNARHLAYVIYTSGSTGQPKGVMVEHRHLGNLVAWHNRTFDLHAGSRTTGMAGVGFDASAWELWPALCCGATLLMPPASTAGDPQSLLRWWHAQKLDVSFVITPLAELAYSSGYANDTAHTVLIGGDRLKRWPDAIGAQQSLVNNYGPTETTVVATSGVLRKDDAALHIGRPIANTRIYILDALGQPVPVGVDGEIHIGGAQVARGYLNRPALSAERFVNDPFGEKSTDSPTRMYRTGDMGRWLADGNIEYLGRNDDQVKIRGFRIELGEIDARLSEVDGVRELAVIAREDTPGEPRLVAYFTASATTNAADAVTLADALRTHASRTLPPHMAPAAYVKLDALPLTANGKLDRKALPAPAADAYAARGYAAPESEAEQTLAHIWSQLLNVERVGRHDNFFELGGHSLLAVRLVERMRQAGLNADVQALFSQPTLAALAAASSAATGDAAAADVPPNRIPADAQRITPPLLSLVDLTQSEIDMVVGAVPGGAVNVQDIYPLAPLQEGVLYHHLASETGDSYLLRAGLAFDSRATLGRFVAALQAVIVRHDILRTGIAWEGLREPVQVVWREAPLPVSEVHDVDPSQGDVAAQLQQRFDPKRYRLDIRQAPPMAVQFAHDAPNGRWVLILLFHHIALDHTGIEILLQEVRAHLLGEGAALQAPPPFRQYVAQARLGARHSTHETFFRTMLSDVDEPTLPYGLANVQSSNDTNDEGDNPALIGESRVTLDHALSARLRAQSRTLGISAASLFHLAWGHVVGKLSGREDVVFGTVLLGRWQSGAGAERALGLFINTLPIRVDVGATGVQDALVRTHQRVSGLLGHEHAALALAQRCSGVAAPAPLFSALLNYRHSEEHGPAGVEAAQGAWQGIEILDGEERTNYPCALSVDDLGATFKLTAQVVARFDAARLCGYLQRTLESLAEALEHAPGTPVRDLAMLPDAERHQLLDVWNATAVAFPADDSVHALFEAQARSAPQAAAIVDGSRSLSYAQLNAQAGRVARHLAGLGTQPGDRVAILLDRSIELIVAELAILKCGAVYVPLDRNAPADRQAFMLADCGAARVLTQRGFAVPEGAKAQRVDLDTLLENDAESGDETSHAPLPPQPGGNAAAYIMYTSGSTGQPKGVVVAHRGVNRLIINNGYADFNAQDRIAFTSNPAFDASTMEVWGALLHGGCLVVVPHADLLSPPQLAALLIAERVSILHLVAGLLSSYADALAPVFTGLRYLLTGGDAADVRAVQRIMRNSAPQHLVHCYGPTESTTFSTTYELRADSGDGAVLPIGRPISNTRVYLLDAHGQPAPLGVPGEIHVGGAGVALGYLNLDTLTAQRFVNDPFSNVPTARMYRTGDLGRYLPDGNIEYLGRNDDQVKIRGFRVEPGEIEAKLSRYGLNDATVIAREDTPGDKRLVVYYTGAAQPVDAIRAYLRESLPEYMVPAAYVALDSMPLTLNGKLDRRALPAPDLGAFGRSDYEAPQGDVEEMLAQIWSQLLNVERVGRHDNFFELGGHSLLAVRVIGRLRQQFGDSATLRALFEAENLAGFAAQLVDGGNSGDGAAQTASGSALVPVERTGPLPLSYVQERLWLIQQRDGGRAYNMHGALRLDGPLSLPALKSAFDSLAARHETLRTRFDFAAEADLPSQFIDANAAVDIDVQPVTQDTLNAELDRHAAAVFDLQRGPLLQVRVLQTHSQRHVVSIVMHHIISDGWSLGVFVNDLRSLYAAHRDGHDASAALSPLTIQYADHAYWQRRQDLRAHTAYWSTQLAGYSDPVDLAVPGTPAGVEHGPLAIVRRRLPTRLAAALGQLSQQRGTSLFTIFLVGLTVLCHRQNGRDDLCIGTTTAGRDDPLLEPLIGFFINILPLRLNLAGNPTASELLDQARQVVLDALEHQALPFEQMIAAVPALRQGDGRSPVPVMLRHQNAPPVESTAWGDGLSVDIWPDSVDRPAQSDLDLEIFGDARGLEVVANLDSHRFSTQQIELMLDVLQEILTRLADAPQAPLSAFLAVTATERALIGRVNQTDVAFAQTSVAALFAQRVAERPDALACRFAAESDSGHTNETASYAELDRRSDRIAHALRRRGVEAGMRIALYHPRSIDLLAAILASFKLGCPYVPVDPGYPAAYVRRTLDDATPAVVISTSALAGPLVEAGLDVLRIDVDLDADRDIASDQPFDDAPSALDDLAYIAYTSGSTGQPKGVMVEQRQVLNCLNALWTRTPFAVDEVVGQKTSMSFVPSIKEMLSGLLVGVSQVVFPDAVVKDAPLFATALREHRVTRLNLVPSHLAVLLDHADDLGTLRHVTTAGEPLSRRVRERFAAALPLARLHNNYGCSELNDISYCEGDGLDGRNAVIPAGRPIANSRVHVLNDALEPVPVGAVGYLFVDGASVGPGYWNRPDLSAERFIVDPSTGARLLRTGDIGQWLPDGQLLHLGREDFQIKVRGQRVELPAVELELSAHPGIAKAAAVGRGASGVGGSVGHESGNAVQLIGFYVPEPGAQLDHELDHNALHAWLSERLPGHMVPSRFVALDALPALPNGKLNRLALAALDIGAGNAAGTRTFEAPQGVLEETIAQIWSDALGGEPVGRHDNFFALGGHSLMASQVAVRIREKLGDTLGVNVTVRSIFDTRSVHKLAVLLASGSTAQTASARELVADISSASGETFQPFEAYNTSGTERPLFLTHTLQGYSWYFEHLAAHIDASIPVYGLPPLPLPMTQPRTLEALAARFVDVIKSVQREGPYRIAGWSFGGLIAYEIATQLLARGDRIEFLGVFDTTLPHRATDVDAHEAQLMTLYSFVVNNFTDFDAQTLAVDKHTDVDELIGRLVRMIGHRKQQGHPLWHLAYESADENRLFLERLVAHGTAMNAWRPTPLDVKAHVFSAADASITPLEGHPALPAELGWQAVLERHNIEVLPVPGNHETIVKLHADVLGALIGNVLHEGRVQRDMQRDTQTETQRQAQHHSRETA